MAEMISMTLYKSCKVPNRGGQEQGRRSQGGVGQKWGRSRNRAEARQKLGQGRSRSETGAGKEQGRYRAGAGHEYAGAG